MVASEKHSLQLKSEELEKKETEKKAVENKNLELLAQISKMNAQVSTLEQQRNDGIADRDKRIAQLQMELFESQKGNIFMSGSPYPIGFDKIKLGDPIEKIAEAYPYENQSKSSSSILLDPSSDIFRWMRFEHDRGKVKGKVDSVSFDTGTLRSFGKNPKPPLPDRWIETALTRALGEPIVRIGVDEKCIVWKVEDEQKSFVFHVEGETDFIISVALWPPGCFITDDQRKALDRKK
jgi:hypothetical protein